MTPISLSAWSTLIVVLGLSVLSTSIESSTDFIKTKTELEDLMLLSKQKHSTRRLLNSSNNTHHLANSIVQKIFAEFTKKLKVTENDGDEQSKTIFYIAPCKTAEKVIESTSTLLAASTLFQAGNETLSTQFIWEYFDTLLMDEGMASVPPWIPKYRYPVITTKRSNVSLLHYVENTTIPNWPIFESKNNTSQLPLDCNISDSKRICWTGSGRVSAMPFHATFLLQLLVWQHENHSEHLMDPTILRKLETYWNKIYQQHQFLHNTVMRGCHPSSSTNVTIPCYNILHPWESLMDPTSSTWKIALKPTLDQIRDEQWTLDWSLPAEVLESHQYRHNQKIYQAMLYLAECLANYTTEADRFAHCPFAMLDVGYAAVLAQADHDLWHVSVWLSDLLSSSPLARRNPVSSSFWDSKIATISKWIEQSNYVLELLWNQDEQSYLSQYAIPPSNSTSLPVPTMVPCKVAVANNFMMFWKQWFKDDYDSYSQPQHHPHLEEMALQMLRRDGNYSFDCGTFGLWTNGCTNFSSIDPKLNYFVGVGLRRNRDSVAAFGDYLTNQTITLICDSRGSAIVDESCAGNLTQFPEMYDSYHATHLLHFPRIYPEESSPHFDDCGTSCTLTIAILAHLLFSEFPVMYPNHIPPIRNSWVITLITLELMIAFSVGATCVYLSLYLVQKENSRTEDANINISTSEPGSYAAVPSFDLEHDNPDEFLSTRDANNLNPENNIGLPQASNEDWQHQLN